MPTAKLSNKLSNCPMTGVEFLSLLDRISYRPGVPFKAGIVSHHFEGQPVEETAYLVIGPELGFMISYPVHLNTVFSERYAVQVIFNHFLSYEREQAVRESFKVDGKLCQLF